MSMRSFSVTKRRLASRLTWSGRMSRSSSAEIWLLALRRLKNSFFWLAVVPILTSDHERRILDRRLDPPQRVGGRSESLVRLEPLDRVYEPEITFRDHLGDRQSVAAIAPGDLGNQPQMTGDEPMGCILVAMFAPALGQHVFFLRFQHRELLDFFQIVDDAAFGRRNGQSYRVRSHEKISSIIAPDSELRFYESMIGRAATSIGIRKSARTSSSDAVSESCLACHLGPGPRM